MYSKLAPSVLSSLLVSLVIGQETNYEAKAWFQRYAMGSVTVINGNVMVDLDVSNVDVGNETLGIPDDCFNDGVYYHIHSEWNHDDMMDYQGTTMCGPGMTAGHWDPWFACSDNSDGVDCRVNGGCIWGSSAVQVNGSYQCSEDTWDSHGFACEVSDFSGKYGMADVRNNRISEMSQHWMEIDGIDFDEDYSIVFHCGDGTRAFCAPFNITMREDTDYERDTGDDKATIDFGKFSTSDVSFKGTEITIGNGYVEVDLPKDVGEACRTWFVRVHGGWEHSSSSPQANDMCSTNYTHGVWDPTHSCIDDSDSMYCDDGTRCPGTTATNVAYTCDNEENALRCAIGDITGRIEEINTGGDSYNERFDDRISMHIEQLAGKSLVLECTRQSDIIDSGIYRVCTEITSSDLSLNGKSSSIDDGEITAGGVIAIILVILVAGGIAVAFLRGKPQENPDFNNPRQAIFEYQQNATLGGGNTTTAGSTISGPIMTNTQTDEGAQKPTAASQSANYVAAASSSSLQPNINNQNQQVMRVGSSSNLNEPDEEHAVEVSPSPQTGAIASPETNETVTSGNTDYGTPQGFQSTAGKLPPPPKHMSMSESKKEDIDLNDNNDINTGNNNNNGYGSDDGNLEEGGNDVNNEDGGENAVYLSDDDENNVNNNTYSTPNGLPSKPEHHEQNDYDNNDDYNNNNEQREDTPDQPATDFEDENGALPNELLADDMDI